MFIQKVGFCRGWNTDYIVSIFLRGDELMAQLSVSAIGKPTDDWEEMNIVIKKPATEDDYNEVMDILNKQAKNKKGKK